MTTPHQNDGCCSPKESEKSGSGIIAFVSEHRNPLISFILLGIGLILDVLVRPAWFSESLRFGWYLLAYIPVGLPVLKQAFGLLIKGDVFSEFFLMGIATIGAFAIGEYPEGVAVMLFYAIGEAFQHSAVLKARKNIRALLDVRPETAHLKKDLSFIDVHPQTVNTGKIIQVLPGERVPLDGKLLSGKSSFDTSALTGESRPRSFSSGETVLSGMVNLNHVIEVEVTRSYDNSSISRILKMVQDAASRKARTELFIRRFARIYTPAVVFLAALLIVLPAFFVSPYIFDDWFYRGLVFLVISCPCALVISIPLGYFGGIGAASKNGILVKGGNYLDALRSVKTVVFDKTGTLTEGTFSVQEVQVDSGSKAELFSILLATEKNSSHPVAKAITHFLNDKVDSLPTVEQQEEIPGFGIRAKVNGRNVLVGNQKLLKKENIPLNGTLKDTHGSVVYVVVDGLRAGTVIISDNVKEDSAAAIKKLRKLGVRQTVMLSGDNSNVAKKIGQELGIDHIFAELLPDEKAAKFQELKKQFPGTIAYAGDGINDAPVLALSDVGIAMGAMGSDVAVETADVVIQTDQPSKIATAIRIGRETRNIVWQNITLALGVKILVLGLGALGMATLWEAVFADVGVALLAIMNAVRIQKKVF